MNVKECDRCGAIFDNDQVSQFVYVYRKESSGRPNKRDPYESERLDLCPECVRETEAFLWGDVSHEKDQRMAVNRSESIPRIVDQIKEFYRYSFGISAKTEQA